MLFGQTKITQSGQSPRIDPFSAVTTMHHTGDKWLISAISLITSPSS